MDGLEITYIVVAGVIGLIVGYSLSYFSTRKRDKSRLEDELTRAKRDLASHKRVINDFFLGGNALFEQMENSYRAYSRYMSEQSRKIMPQLGNMFQSSVNEKPKENVTKIIHEEKEVIDIMPDTKIEEETAPVENKAPEEKKN